MQLIITEKPRASLKIADALADSKAVKKSVSSVPYYELTHNGKEITVVCAVGHLFGLTEKNKSSRYPVEEMEWIPKETFAKKYAFVIEKLAKQADDFVIACDYDLEGEIIGFNVLRFLCKQKDAKRMKFSTLTKPEIVAAYENAADSIDWGQVTAGETRHYLDFMYGISLSRALMQAIKKGGIFRKLSIGRVQGPALSILAKKEREIQKFKPTPYWQISLLVVNGEEIFVVFPKKILEKNALEEFEKLKGKSAVAKTTSEEVSWKPQSPFDLTTLQTEAYKNTGLTPSQLIKVAQTLYLDGLISYPRTSSQKLPAAIGYNSIIQSMKKLFPTLTKNLTRKVPIEGKQSDPAHPSIYPTGENPKKLYGTEKSVYELIVRRFLACFAEDAILKNKRINIKIGDKEFFAKGLEIKKKGWLDIYPSRIDEIMLPDINGEVRVKDVKIAEKETQPPRRYSPASIIAELAKRNLGTKGTRALILDTLYDRGYAKDRSIVVTNLGLSVEEALEKYSPLILNEELTRKFGEDIESIQSEKDIKKIQKAQQQTLAKARETLIKISDQFRENEDKIGKMLVDAYKVTTEKERKENLLAKCNCGGDLMVRISKRTKKRFVACSEYPKCTVTFPLPQQGYVKRADKSCEKCGKQMVTLIKKGRKPWTICFAGCGFLKTADSLNQ